MYDMSHRLSAWILALTIACVTLVARPALAWIETTVLADEVHVEVDKSGQAKVEHRMTLRIRGATMRGLTLSGTPAGAQPTPSVTATALDKDGKEGDSQSLSLTTTPDGALRLESPGLPRGTYALKLEYTLNLEALMQPAGGMVLLRFPSLRYPNGVDSLKVVFGFPSAPEAPRVAADGPEGMRAESPAAAAMAEAAGFLSTLRRSLGRDELEITKPHVSRNDPIFFLVKVDPRALGAVENPSVVPPPAATVTRVVQESRADRQVFLLVGLGIAILMAALTAMKAKTVEERAAAHGAKARPWVPLPATARAIAAGLVFAAGVALELFVHPPWLGALVVAVSMLLMAHRAPLTKPVARGPGRWLAVSAGEAFDAKCEVPGSVLDASSWRGRLGLLLALLAVGLATYGAWTVSPYHAPLAALDGLVVVALFLTGRETELPKAVEARAKRMLAKVHRTLAREPRLRAVPWARFENGSTSSDEVRVLVTPRRPLKGLLAIEVGVVLASGSGGFVTCPAVLVRVSEDTDAAEMLARRFGEARLVRGRKPGERVLSLEPRDASVATTLAVVRALCRELEERPTSAAKRPARRVVGRPVAAGA